MLSKTKAGSIAKMVGKREQLLKLCVFEEGKEGTVGEVGGEGLLC